MSARVQFVAGGLSLIHIPLHLFPHFLQPIIRLLFLSEKDEKRPEKGKGGQQRDPWASLHPFLNISVTPIECSLVCLREHAEELFLPLLNALGDVRDQVSITVDDYVALQVDGVGLDAARRVVELTSPLALARIPIFFITTYFSDYILVPAKSQGDVSRALEERGFVFEKHGDAFVNHSHYHYYHRGGSSAASPIEGSPQSPGPSNLDELQLRTFALLRRRNVVPTVDTTIRIVHCAGSKEVEPKGRAHASQLQIGLIKCLAHRPRFLSLTLTDTESASLFLEKSLLRHFDNVNEVLLGGCREDMLIPITLDLKDLPLESTGIVCGIAGRLVGAPSSASPSGSPTSAGDYHPMSATSLRHPLVDMCYLSTARAGTVMVAEEELGWVIEELCGAANVVDV